MAPHKRAGTPAEMSTPVVRPQRCVGVSSLFSANCTACLWIWFTSLCLFFSEVFIGGVLSPYALIGRNVSLYVKPATPLFFSLNKSKGRLYFKRRTGKNRRTAFLEHKHITCRISSWKPFGAEGHWGYYYHCLHLHKGAFRAGFKLQSTSHQLHCHKWGRKIYHETVRLYLFLWTLPGPPYLSTSGAFSFLHLPLCNCHGTGKLKGMLPAEAQWRTGRWLPGDICRRVTVSDVELVAVRRACGAEIWIMPVQRLQGCRSLHLNEDNGRFVLLAILIILYLLCGAAVFSAIERPSELRAHGRWNGTLLNFSETFNISLQEINSFLREYEAAIAAGIRADALRPRWDFTGAFYFVGTVVSTIGG